MNGILTLAEIESAYGSEWVFLEDPQPNTALDVQCGRVRRHSKDRDEVYGKAIELRTRRFAVLFTGEMPEDTAIVL